MAIFCYDTVPLLIVQNFLIYLYLINNIHIFFILIIWDENFILHTALH